MNQLDNIVLLCESRIADLREKACSSDMLVLRCGSSPWRSAPVFFGLQYYLKRWLVGRIVTENAIQEAKVILQSSRMTFDDSKWRYILTNHDGKLPLRIKAPEEGMNANTFLLLIETTDNNCRWLLQSVRTILELIWYPMTVCTLSRSCKLLLAESFEQTSMLHVEAAIEKALFDFGYRGSTTVESAGIGGCAHLVNFTGSSTIAALTTARSFYHADMPATAIPSAEHSTITSWGRDREAEAYRNMLLQFPTGKVSCVSDSYDIVNACEKIWGTELHDLVRSRDGSGTVCVRPDSGDPASIVLQTTEILASKFGYETNEKGYRVLPPYLRLIQGDGVSYSSIGRILTNLKEKGWSSENVTFGSGGSLLQLVNRNMLNFEWLSSGTDEHGVHWVDRELPKTRSADDNDNADWQQLVAAANCDGISIVFENGILVKDLSLEQIRKNASTCVRSG